MDFIRTREGIMDFFGEYPLIAASLRLTMGCNARCKHCYTDGGKRLQNEFATEKIKDLLDQLSNFGVQQVFFTGGEPFLRADIIEILNYANEKKFEILISTNGTLIREDLVSELAHIDFKQFQVSIDNVGYKHDENRGRGFFVKANAAVDILKKYKVKNITIGTCITKFNLPDIPDILNYVIEKEIDKFALMLLLPAGRATIEMDVDVKELLYYLDIFWDIYRKNSGKILFAENSVLPPVFVPKDLREKNVHKQFDMCCSYPNIMGIGADGKVAPCDGFLNWERYISGNVNMESIKEIWIRMQNSSYIIPRDSLEIEGICSQCIFLESCGGNCRADSVAYYGRINAPYPICQKLHEKGLFPKECLRYEKPAENK